MDTLKHVRQQGRDAKKNNDDNAGNAAATIVSAHDCPYGPGEMRDAWLAGFGGQEEAVEQVDTSTATTDDVRPTGNTDTVKEGAKPKGTKAAKAKQAKEAVTVTTDVTGTGETALKTKVEPTNPELSDRVPTPSTVLGDPTSSQGPNDANVMKVDEATGRTDGAPEGAPATGKA